MRNRHVHELFSLAYAICAILILLGLVTPGPNVVVAGVQMALSHLHDLQAVNA